MVRLYIELDNVREGELPRGGRVSPAELTEVANRILHPYTLEVRDIGWWSVYEIGRRLCERFDNVPDDAAGRVPRGFIAGDACHTHGAKSGQGMNVSMADTWNLGWKLAAVLRESARPELLHTYSVERREVAQQLIDFDREFAALFSGHGDPDSSEENPDPEKFQRYFRDQGRYTAGFAVRYAPSMITAAAPAQGLASGFEVGTRFHSASVVRLADAKPLHLGHVARADGAWRLYIFADRAAPTSPNSRVRRFCEHLASPPSPLRRHTPADAEPDAVIDVRAVFQAAQGTVRAGRPPPTRCRSRRRARGRRAFRPVRRARARPRRLQGAQQVLRRGPPGRTLTGARSVS